METILIVDDEPNICRLLSYNLGQRFEVATTSNGKEAIDWLERHEVPDLIIADIMMPLMDGYQFLQTIRRQARFNNTPVIFLSAKSQSADRIEGLRLGADDFVVKPFNVEELTLRIEKMIDRKKKAEA